MGRAPHRSSGRRTERTDTDGAMAAAPHDRIRVVVRVRPRVRADSPSLWQYDQQCVAPLRTAQPGSTYTFDRVFGEAATTDQVYAAFAQPIALSVLTGVNGLLSTALVLSANIISSTIHTDFVFPQRRCLRTGRRRQARHTRSWARQPAQD